MTAFIGIWLLCWNLWLARESSKRSRPAWACIHTLMAILCFTIVIPALS